MAQMLYGFAGWPVQLSMFTMLAIIAIIMLAGGLWSVAITDVAQTLFGYVTMSAVLAYLLLTYGGFSWLYSHIPGAEWRLSFPGKFEVLSLGPNVYPTWILLWFFALIFGSPYYWLRAVATRSDRAARNGYIAAGVFGLILMVVIMPLIGLYSIAIRPGVFTPFGGEVHPAGAIGVLANAIPHPYHRLPPHKAETLRKPERP